jgi:8-oxo-dGTP diphosphatase
LKPLHVAVGVITDNHGQILIAKRCRHRHQGGLWEFPGGKVEIGECVVDALRRELQEELGITVESASPLIKITHSYPDRNVLLDVWHVDRFRGEAFGRESQAVAWVCGSRLKEYAFPEANRPIIAAAKLPECYAILDHENDEISVLQKNLRQILDQGIHLVQLRAKSLPAGRYDALAADVCRVAARYSATILLNAEPEQAVRAGAAGVHLTGKRLTQMKERPLGESHWVAASCHTLEELKQAERLKLDFVVLSPVMPTATHPEATPLGWNTFEALVAQVNIPIYALGGLTLSDLRRARKAGAQGIAGIRTFLLESK